MNRAEYARLRALVDLRLDELRDALDRHEADQRLGEARILVGTEQVLADLVARVRGNVDRGVLPGQASNG